MATDLTLERPKALKRFRIRHHQLLHDLLQSSPFNRDELDALVNIFVKMIMENGPDATQVKRFQFRSMLHVVFDMPDDILIERMFTALDSSMTTNVPFETFVRAMALFLRGTLTDRIRFCFAVYDLAGEGYIKRKHLSILLRNAVIKQQVEDANEMIKDMLDVLTKKFDVDGDGIVSFDDYSKTVQKQPTLLEVFGHCLPSRESVYAFMSTFSQRIGRF